MPSEPNTQKRSALLLPYIALGVGILSLGLSPMFVRWADAPGPVTGFYRLLIAALLLAPFVVGKNAGRREFSWKMLVFPLIGGLASGFDLAFWTTSIHYTTAANATVIGNTAPLWVALAGLLLFRERLKGSFWLGLSLTLGGAIVMVGSDFLNHPGFGIGDLLALGSSLFYAIYYIATEYGRKSLDSLSYTWLVASSAAVTLAVINVLLQNPFSGYSSQTWLAFFGAAVVSQIFGYFSVSYALGHLPASVVSPTMIGQPVVSTILAIPLLGEIPAPLQVLGGLVVLTGIYLVNQAHSRVKESSAATL